jgi:5-methylcytosine-specific restriction enzyme A
MNSRFSKKVMLAAFERAGGRCEDCGKQLLGGVRIEYDHRIAKEFGGNSTLENCCVLCRPCHRKKTSTKDIPAIAKSRRIRIRQAGIIEPRTITAWRRFDGTPVKAKRER